MTLCQNRYGEEDTQNFRREAAVCEIIQLDCMQKSRTSNCLFDLFHYSFACLLES